MTLPLIEDASIVPQRRELQAEREQLKMRIVKVRPPEVIVEQRKGGVKARAREMVESRNE